LIEFLPTLKRDRPIRSESLGIAADKTIESDG